MVVYQLSTAARQEARQWSAEVNIVFSAQHMKAVQSKKEAPHWCAQGNMRTSFKWSKIYVKPVWGVVSKLDRQRERTALAQNAKHGRRVRLASSQNMYSSDVSREMTPACIN